MNSDTAPLIFDGHNDFLLHLARGKITVEDAVYGTQSGQIDFLRARKGGFGGGFFALWVPSTTKGQANGDEAMTNARYDVPLPGLVSWEDAMKVVVDEIAALRALERTGKLKICTTADDLETTFHSEKTAAVMHLEGAEAIDPDFSTLEVLHAAGLRSLGPVWSRPTIFGHGVPFRFPSTGDTGPGLTEAGKELVRQCNRLKIMLDVSHLNEKGFNDLAALTDAPIIATHSNAHVISPHARNLTDRQLAMIAESDGMVGLNFATAFLRPDGRMAPDMPIEIMLRHLDHLMEKVGEDRVGFGSDFDGAIVPQAIGDVAGLPVLRHEMRAHGYDEALLTKLCHGNWFRVLRKTWNP